MIKPEMHVELRESDVRHTARVVSSRRISPESVPEEVKELVLALHAPGIRFEAGQSIGVLAPGSPEFGNQHHLRLYTVADLPEIAGDGMTHLRICVKRCYRMDPYTGERHPGVASHYLCSRRVGDTLTVTGPYGLPFAVPEEPDANLILIGTGTGIAPFRAFVKHLHHNVPEWTGRIWLFYGAKNGLEMLYMNDEHDDFAQYYDPETFEAFKALSPRPHWSDPIAWDLAFAERGSALLRMLEQPKTYVYVAGLEAMRNELDHAFAGFFGSPEKWARRKAELVAGGRWVELLY